MTGPEHYQAAEIALEAAAATQGDELHYTATEALLDALAHAMLANTAAVIASGISVMKPTELGEWRRAMDPDYAAGDPVSYPGVFPSGPAAAPARPARCTCASPVAATLAETLACPLAWHELPDGTWEHTSRINAGAGLRAGTRTGGLA